METTTVRKLQNGKYRVLVNGRWNGTTLSPTGAHLSGPYLTYAQCVELAKLGL